MPEQAARRDRCARRTAATSPTRAVARQHGPSRADDQPAPDLLLLEQRALVRAVRLEPVGVEHRPVGREGDQQREQQHDEAEQVADARVHALRPLADHRAAPRRAARAPAGTPSAAARAARSWRRSSCRRS